MTKIIEKNKTINVHLHIDKAYKIIDSCLPFNYVDQVLLKLNDSTLTSGIIRNIKNRVTKYPQTRIPVLNALVEIAQEHKLELEQLEKLTK